MSYAQNTRDSVHVNTRNNVRAQHAAACYRIGMSDEWFDRLKECVENDERSLRAISADMGVGVNYVQQMLRNRKDPGFTRLAKLLNTLGTGATLYVVSGNKMTDQDAEFFRVALSLPPHVRQEALSFFRALQDREGGEAQADEIVD